MSGGSTVTTPPASPGYEKTWFDVKSRQMTSG